MKDKKNNISVILAVIAIVVIVIILALATFIKFNYDNTLNQANDEESENNDFNNNDVIEDENLDLSKQHATNYILALESSFQQNLSNDPNYVMPNNEYITEVIYDLGIDVYPESVNLFVQEGKVVRGNITINAYTFNYENGFLS